VPRKGRARRFREARELKQGFDDGLFRESPERSLADVEDDVAVDTDDDDDDWDDEDDDEYDPLDH
jgi:hypothetical protein